MSTNRPSRAARWASLARLRRSRSTEESAAGQRGQVLPIFAVMAVVLLGGAALLTDVAWWWTNEQRMQRAADAAALAGAVYLPGDEAKAFDAAFKEAIKNGYTNGAGGVVIRPRRDAENPRELIVDINGPVRTNFARVFCWQGGPCLQTVPVGVTGAAEFVLPVPMGSPENYYGVFGMTRGLTSSAIVPTPHSDPRWSCTSGSGNQDTWTPSSGCQASVPSQATGTDWAGTNGSLNSALSSEGGNSSNHARGTTPNSGTLSNIALVASNFGIQGTIPAPPAGESVTILGVTVRLTDTFIDNSCNGSNIEVQISRNGGGAWSAPLRVPSSGGLPQGQNNQEDYVVGTVGSMAAWGYDPVLDPAWTRGDFSDANFRVRLIGRESCNGTRQFTVDRLDVRVKWTRDYTTTALVTSPVADQLLRGPGSPCTTGKTECYEANGPNLNPRGFWATLNTQGAENVNGDAYQPGYDTRTGGVSPACPQSNRACYDATNFYNYAIELPPNATNGNVYIYDPQFCSVDVDAGTGDRWFGGNAAVSTFYTLYDTKTSLYDLVEDAPPIASSDSRFRSMGWGDSTMGGNGGSECMYRADSGALYNDGRDWHNRWYLLHSGLTGGAKGKIYRVHTSSTDPGSPSNQLSANGENSFAIYVSADVPSGGPTPRVYGLGAMQAFTPLKSNSAIDTNPNDDVISEFYLAQIEAAHAGKTIEIKLWDPGDTAELRAELQILRPIDNGAATATNTGWSESNFTYTAAQGTTNSSRASCNALTSNGTTSVLTNNGGGSAGRFNGCWLTMRARLPDDYEANEDGWWKIRYRMDGDDTSNDVTTWQVNLIGNPVHLVPE